MAKAEDIIGLVALVGVLGSVILGIICITLYNMLKVVRETSLKKHLVEAGLTATEIEIVLSAGNGKRTKAPAEKPIVAKKVPPKAAAYS